MELSIIIVNWNTCELLNQCINSIKKETSRINYEIIVFDNDSADDSKEVIKKNHPDVILIESEENLGFGIGNNKAVERAKGEYVLLLNPDTVITNNAINKSLEYIKSIEGKALVGCKLLNKDGTIQFSSAFFPSIYRIISGAYAKTEEKHQVTHETEWVMGAFMLLSRAEYNELKGFDEDFFMYSEDMDLCYRLIKNGGKVIYFSDAEIIHYYNQSGSKKWNNNREEKIKEAINLYCTKNLSNFKSNLYTTIYNLRHQIKKLKYK